MISFVRTKTLRELRADAAAARALRADAEGASAEAEGLRKELAACRFAEGLANDAAIRGEHSVERLLQELDRANSNAARAEGQLEVLTAQQMLDTEDRAMLRMLLRIVRKQSRPADRVYALFRRGALHSVHATIDAAEAAAEAEGAPRSGWTRDVPGAGLPPAAEVAWRVQSLSLGGA